MSFSVGMYISIASFICSLISIILDQKGDEIYGLDKKSSNEINYKKNENNNKNQSNILSSDYKNDTIKKISADIKSKQALDTDTPIEELKKEYFESVVITQNSHFKNLPAMFWLTNIFTVFCYGAYLPFNFIASGFLIETFLKHLPKETAQQTAGIYMSLPFIISCFFVPIFGCYVDKYGKRANITILSSILGIIGFSTFLCLDPIFGFIIIGFSYSFTSTVVWNIISIVLASSSFVKINFILLFLKPY